ncbi:MAG TPA: GldG family protein [bacterium]|nr:GldG family protein [bacterium]
MKYVFIRLQLVFVSIILFLTFAMVMGILVRFNTRWDFTHEKLYSLSDPTLKLLKALSSDKIEVLAFYPQDDPARANVELFLKECKLRHPDFQYQFYDPDRVPSLAHRYKIEKFYTFIIQYAGRSEKVIQPTEESFTNALVRIRNPKKYGVCFTTVHGEAEIKSEDRTGLKLFADTLRAANYDLHEIILSRDKVPSFCDVIIVPGPHRDLDNPEYALLAQAFVNGKGIFFMVDPMDPGTGHSFRDFFKGFGVLIGEDVIVDKMSRLVGGDFLVPLVSQYVTDHPITAHFEKPTFFPVARSVQPSTEAPKTLEVTPLALSGSGSWAETNLSALEKGDAVFNAESDVTGPICLMASVEKLNAQGKSDAQSGRMVIIGDSDFVSNAYNGLSANNDLAVNSVNLLSKDDRFVQIPPRNPEFKPLFLTDFQRLVLLGSTIAFPAVLFLIAGSLNIFWRKKKT